MIKELPLFVSLNGTKYAKSCLRRVGENEYYRDNGSWSCFAEYKGKVLTITKCPGGEHLEGLPLKKVSQKEWQEDNNDSNFKVPSMKQVKAKIKWEDEEDE